ncbi:MAG: hypothetical protein K5945_00880, partial [Bacteroidaceae bacterium]|nr:hypothetical protein [Bacteroidaceae bacterium]
MKKLCMMLLAIVGFAMSANAITLTVVSGDKNDPGNNEGCQKLVDGNYGTKWGDGISEGQTKYVIVKSNVAIIPASYVLVTGNDTAGGNSGRNWNNWKVYAGNFASDADAARNAEGWVLIDQRTNVGGTDQLPAANSQATPPFVLTETVTAPYLYFKIEIESCVDLNTYMQMGEFFFDKYTVDLSAFAEDIAAANSFDYKKAGDALLEAEYEALLKKLNASEDADEVDATLTQLTNVKNFINSQAEKEFLALSGSNTWGDGGWANFVDGNYDTKWGGGLGSEGMWIVFRVKGGVQPYVYRLVTGGDTKSYWDRNWSTWTVYGANFASVSDANVNSDQWVALDIRQDIGQDLFPAENRNPTTFTFTEGVNEPYYYYKVHVTKSYNNGSNQQMSEIEFLTKAQLDEQKQAYIDEYASVDLEAEVEPWHQAEKATFIETLNQLKETNDVLEMSKLNNTLAGLKSTLEASIEDRAAQQERYEKGGFLPLAGNTAWGNGENWTRLIDENHDSKWGGGRPEDGSFVIFKKADAVAPELYTLVTGNDTQGSPDRNWATWKIYGANFAADADAIRDAEWVLLDSKENIGQDMLPGANFAPAYFSFSEKVAQAYQYFKIEISASFNNGGNIQMSEFKMITPAELEAIKAAYVEEMAPFINAVYADDAMKLKYNAALREISIAAPEGILAAVAAAQAVQNEILAAQPELTAVDGVYQIGTAGELMTFARLVNNSEMPENGYSAVLTGDIDLTAVPYEYIKNFKGTFDGQGHAIKNLSINQSSTSEIGLFGVAENATITRVMLVNASVNGNNNAGCLVGRAINSTISKCAVIDSYAEGRDHVGTIAGEIRGNVGTIFTDNYSNSVTYSREYQAGGMIGTILGGTVEHNLFTGTVDAGGGRSGGLIALLDGNESNILIKNNAIFATSVDCGWGTGDCYAIMMRAGRNASYENNYSLSTATYCGETFNLTNPNDENGGQVDWATSTTK